jgi:hypothetical protein
MTVEVFKTNVKSKAAARQLVTRLQLLFPDSRVNFDLEDCDRVLRIEGRDICSEKTISLLNADGYSCGVLG